MRTRESFSIGWQSFKAQAVPLMVLTFILLLTQALISAAASLALRPGIASLLASGLVWGGFMTLARKVSRGAVPTMDDAFAPFRERQIDFLIVGAAAASGAVLGPLGGLVTGFFTLFSASYVADGDDFKTALLRSKDAMIAQPWPALRLFLGLIAVNLLGAAALGVGLLVSIPVSALAVLAARSQAAATYASRAASAQP